MFCLFYSPGSSRRVGFSFLLQELYSATVEEAVKEECPNSVLLHGGCSCLWYFVYNVNLYVLCPPHTLLVLLHLSLSVLSVFVLVCLKSA